MTDRVEEALRAQPPDEPTYRGNILDRLAGADLGATEPSPPPLLVELASGPRARHTRLRAQIAAITAAAACVVAIVLVSIGRDPSRETVGTPVVTTPPVTEAGPSSLDGRWVGRSRASGDGSAAAPWFLVLDDGSVALERSVGGIVNDFVSDLTDVAGGNVRLTLTDQTGGCAPGAMGDYTFTRSPGGSTLTLDVVDDQCVPRGEAFAGTWTRVDCPTRGRDCLGPLEAGRHDSVSFDPFGTGSYGQISYEVPAGWSSPLDDGARFALEPTAESTADRHGLYLFADVAALADACSTTAASATGGGAIATALSGALDRADASTTVTRSTVGGFEARIVDLTTAATSPCGGSVPILTARTDSQVAWTLTAGVGQRLRVVLVDLPERTMAIVVASDGPDQEYDALLDIASRVIDSFMLDPAP